MSLFKLVIRSLGYYWRANLGTLLAIAVSGTILTGALVVGDSVEYSLGRVVTNRLGGVEFALTGQDRFFTTELAEKLGGELDAPAAAVLQLRGLVSNSDGTKWANRIELYGVDESFYKIGGAANPFSQLRGRVSDREDNKSESTIYGVDLEFLQVKETANPFSDDEGEGIVLNESLAERIGVGAGDEILLRINKPSLMPREVPLTPDSDSSMGFRLTVKAVAEREQFGHFSLQANQVVPLNAFVPLKWLQEKLERSNQANILLVGSSRRSDIEVDKANEAIRSGWRLVDAGLELGDLTENHAFELRSSRVFIDSSIGQAAIAEGEGTVGVFTYFVNELRLGERSTPYSMVTAMSRSDDAAGVVDSDMGDDEIVVNRWLADDIGVKKGDEIEVSYFVISRKRKLEERTSNFRVRKVVAIEGLAGDVGLTPNFPGLADEENCRDWKPGIPIDLDKIREKDEEYWDEYRGTAKAFITLEAGQKIWGNRYGNLTSVRYSSVGGSKEQLAGKILNAIEPASLGLYFRAVRSQGMKASTEGTDFGQLFVGFSMFLIMAALVLVGMLFVFGVEKRSTEIGMLFAVGCDPRFVRRLFIIEGAVLAIVGTVAGTAAGVLYTKAMIYGLATVWRVAVSGAMINFAVKQTTLLTAALSGVVVSMLAIWFALCRQFRKLPRQLLNESLQWQFFTTKAVSKGRLGLWVAGFAVSGAAVLIVVMGGGGSSAAAGAFFGAGVLLLIAGISLLHSLLEIVAGSWKKSVASIGGLGVRSSARRSGRSLGVAAMLSCGVFLVIAIGANRHDPLAHADSRDSGTGGFALYGESAIGVLQDLDSEEGRKVFGLEEGLADVDVVQLRVRDGDDASCFNLNRAQQPRVLGVEPTELQQRNAFLFTKAIEAEEAKEWELLEIDLGEDVVAAVGDEATIRWALGKSIGDEIEYTDDKGKKFRIRLVGMLKNSILQGSLLIAEDEFIERFAAEEGYRMLLVDSAEEKSAAVSEIFSERLKDFGMEMTTAKERLAAFSAVENTYLSIFQLLGSLGLILGSVGLGVVVLRNVLDRRGELAMLRAVGFDKKALKKMVFYEHAGLMLCGLLLGIVAALAALEPVLKSPGAQVGYSGLILTVTVLVISGIIWIWLATSVALSGKVLDGLRSE